MSDLLKKIQIPIENIKDYIDENTVLVIDSDGLCLKGATILEDRFIEAIFKANGKSREFANISEFRGKTRNKSISDMSWLGNQNAKRVAEGKPEFTLDDFEIKNGQRLRLGFSVCEDAIDNHITSIKEHLGIENVICLLGEGENFRHELMLPEKYKDNRKNQIRPLKLQDAREYLRSWYKVKDAKDIEADDWLSIYGYKGYLDYKKTGKFSYIVAAEDKDALQTPSLLMNWGKDDGEFKHPNPYLIEDHKTVGEIDLFKDKSYGSGLSMVCLQMLVGDSSDNYSPTKGVRDKTRFGQKNVFKLLYPLETNKELLQAVVDKYMEWYPEGVTFKSWNEEVVEMDTLSWMEIIFKCAYMIRSPKDKTTFSRLLDLFEVNYEHCKDNFKGEIDG